MTPITISEIFKSKWSQMQLACLECDVVVEEKNEFLWAEIDKFSSRLHRDIKVEDISKIPSVASSRKGYKAVGKDPARYRLSAEALMRRIVKGNSLYQINNVVDIVNLASAKSGFSIGGYDVYCIQGKVELGIGKAEEPYVGLGRGELNIEFLPVLRDDIGVFGSPTSDSNRTCVTENTIRFLMVYFGFGAHEQLESELAFAKELLIKYANASNFEEMIMS